jgi:hypothetical protein
MPQYARKTRQMISVAGVHPPVYADKLYTVVGSVMTLVGKTQYISKAVGNTWPAFGWSPLGAPTVQVTEESVKKREIERLEVERLKTERLEITRLKAETEPKSNLF